MRLLLIRHGQTPANVGGVLDAEVPGPGLTELGTKQAAALPRALGDNGIERIFVSNMVRTQLTAAPLAAALDVEPIVLPGLREIGAGSLQGATDRGSVERYVATVMSWVHGDRSLRMPGGDDGNAFFARYDDAVRAIEATGAVVAAIVSHGSAIRAWAGATANDIDPDFVAHRPLGNTGIVELDGSFADGWSLVRWEGESAGGECLDDHTAPDPTGEQF